MEEPKHIGEVVGELMSAWEKQIDWDASDIVKCAQCRDINLHIVEVAVNQNGKVIVISKNKEHKYQCSSDGQSGAIVCVRLACENGHLIDWKYQFHGGSTFLVKTFTPINLPNDWPITLWRN
jgi:hypothetical protein